MFVPISVARCIKRRVEVHGWASTLVSRYLPTHTTFIHSTLALNSTTCTTKMRFSAQTIVFAVLAVATTASALPYYANKLFETPPDEKRDVVQS